MYRWGWKNYASVSHGSIGRQYIFDPLTATISLVYFHARNTFGIVHPKSFTGLIHWHTYILTFYTRHRITTYTHSHKYVFVIEMNTILPLKKTNTGAFRYKNQNIVCIDAL